MKRLRIVLTYLVVAVLAVLASEAKADGPIMPLDAATLEQAQKEVLDSLKAEDKAEFLQIIEKIEILKGELFLMSFTAGVVGMPDKTWSVEDVDDLVAVFEGYIQKTKKLMSYYGNDPFRKYLDALGFDADEIISYMQLDVERVKTQINTAKEALSQIEESNSI